MFCNARVASNVGKIVSSLKRTRKINLCLDTRCWLLWARTCIRSDVISRGRSAMKQGFHEFIPFSLANHPSTIAIHSPLTAPWDVRRSRKRQQIITSSVFLMSSISCLELIRLQCNTCISNIDNTSHEEETSNNRRKTKSLHCPQLITMTLMN
jgi:hypothetical protein